MSKTRSKPPKQQSKKTRMLSGGNPQIPKGEGDAPVQAYIEAMPVWKCDVGRYLDSLPSLMAREYSGHGSLHFRICEIAPPAPTGLGRWR